MPYKIVYQLLLIKPIIIGVLITAAFSIKNQTAYKAMGIAKRQDSISDWKTVPITA